MGGRGVTIQVSVVLIAASALIAACGDADAPDAADDVAVEVQEVAELDFPTGMAQRPGTDELYVTERAGTVRRILVDGDGFTVEDPVVLDLTSVVGTDLESEGGLLNLAFSPGGEHVYLSLTRDEPGVGGRRTVFEYAMTAGGIDGASQRTIFDFESERGFIHTGGGLEFGPDGYLYVGFGDSAPCCDGRNTGQDRSDLLASIVRIDPSQPGDGRPYGIPDDNPYRGGGGAPEVWAFGMRQPWRFTFDPQNGDLWAADVGDQAWEEINFLPADDDGRNAGRGVNLGWSIFQGTHRDPLRKAQPAPDDHVPPIHESSRGDNACSAAIGGYVYRGEAISDLEGSYLFADLCGTTIERLVRDGDSAEASDVVELTGVVSFATDASNEIYALTSEAVWKLVPAT